MKNVLVVFLVFTSLNVFGQAAYINEVNYLISNPTERGMEIAGQAGQDLEGWSLVFYTASGTVDYVEYLSDAIIPSQQNGYGTIWFDVEQSGGNSGVALVNINEEAVQFLSYGALGFLQNTLIGVEGPAAGLTAKYIGMQIIPENSLQLVGTGTGYLDFLWSLPSSTTPGTVNTNQYFPGFAFASASTNNNNVPQQSVDIQSNKKQSIKFNSFPNPAINYLNIQLSTMQEEAIVVELYDRIGRNIQRANFDVYPGSTQQLDLTGLPSGQYLVSVKTTHQVTTQVFVKQ